MSENTALTAFKSEFESQKEVWGQTLPPHIKPQQFVSTVMSAIARNPSLLKVDRRSLIVACCQAAEHGLLPDGTDGIITPFKDRASGKMMAQWMPMVRGVIKRARELGDLTAINAYVVHEKDAFEVVLGDEPHISHRPHIGKQRGEIIAAYAIFKRGDEVIHREVMTREEIDKTRGVSRAANGGAWRDWFAEMARKTVIRRGAKSVPMSSTLTAIVQHEDAYVDFNLKPEPEAKPVEQNPLLDGFGTGQDTGTGVEARMVALLESDLQKCASFEEVRKVLAEHASEVSGIEDMSLRERCRSVAMAHLEKFSEKAA